MFLSLAQEALDVLSAAGVEYGDVRVMHSIRQEITVSGEKPEVVRSGESVGYGVRALVDGAWGFAASDVLTKTAARQATRKAIAIARASRKVFSDKERYLPAKRVTAYYVTPHTRDPFSVSLEEKLNLLTAATRILLKKKGIAIARGFADAFKETKLFASTIGSVIEQEITGCGAGIMAYAIAGGEVQQRSYPNSFRGNFATAGWEFVEEMDLAGNAHWVADEALALLKAKDCPVIDDATIILAPDQLALQIHESIGHPVEFDRILGQEASFAGTSFLNLDMLGSFQYASPEVTVLADATAPRGLGTFAYDDEGTPAQRLHIIKDGILMNFLTSSGTAPHLGRRVHSNGTARAQGWQNIPLIRMSNINLEPGTWDFNNLLADTEHGFLLETNKSWSIDDKRINFQFGTEIAREIKNGKIGRIYKNPIYTGITPKFWNSCDAVCNANYWEFYGVLNCGKGEPVQTMYVGHGTPPARFRGVKLGASTTA